MSAQSGHFERQECELLVAPFTVCGEPTLPDDDLCVEHRTRSLRDILTGLGDRYESAREAARQAALAGDRDLAQQHDRDADEAGESIGRVEDALRSLVSLR